MGYVGGGEKPREKKKKKKKKEKETCPNGVKGKII